jgi:hypothetical protein
MTRRRSSGDVPIVIKEAEKAYERDLKPAVNLIADFADILFGTRPGVPKPAAAQREAQRPIPVRLPPANRIVITEIKGNNGTRPRTHGSSGPPIIDAEIIEDEEIPRICPTCGGAGRLGRRGFEVPCPSCNWPADR